MFPVLKALRYRKIKSLKQTARTFELQRDWSKAQAIWDRISQEDSSYFFAYIKLGNLFNELGERQKAISQFEKIPDAEHRYYYDKYVGIAGVYERMDDWQASLAAWEKAIKGTPATPENSRKIALALAHKAKCLLKLNQLGESNKFITAALYLDRQLRGETDATLTLMALAQGDAKKIRAIVDRARRLGNRDEIIETMMMRLI